MSGHSPSVDYTSQRERVALARLERVPLDWRMMGILLTLGMAVLFDFADQLSLSYVAPSLRDRLGFEVSNIAQLTSATLLGMMVGGALGGRIADRFGRIRVLQGGVLLGSLGTLSFAFIQGLPEFVALRFFTGWALGALYIVAITYVIEISPPSRRSTRTAFVSFFGTTSVIVVATLARIIIPMSPDAWRWVFALGGLGLLLTIPLKFLLPESPLWLMSRGRHDDAEAALNSLDRSPEPVDVASLPLADSSGDEKEAERGKWADLFRGGLLIPTLLLMALWSFFQFAAQAMSVWFPTLLQLRGYTGEDLLNTAMIGSIGGPVGVLTMMIAMRYIHRWIAMVFVASVAIVGAVLLALAPSPEVLAIGALMMFYSGGAFVPLIDTTTGGQYPTHLRASGMGFTFGWGRMTSVLGPFVIAAILTQLGAGPFPWVLLSAWAMIALVSVLLHARRKARNPGDASEASVTHAGDRSAASDSTAV
ncbi:MFS transporter [Gordonia mangrovi]|nr:MFS transporter [Gordonia mangrovi]UVF76693.1 MFS transporter [Gordonia mangrovi]